MQQDFRRLREPLQLGSFVLNNRMVMSPMWTRLSAVTGEVTQQIIDHYVARAKGGASLIMVESTAVDGRHLWHEPQLRIDDTKYMPGLRRLVEAIQLNGVPVIIELHHVGAYGSDPISPSGVPCMLLGGTGVVQPRTMTLKEIEETREAYINAAKRVKDIGADGVLIHGCTSYLMMQFFSPYFNKRTDEYGGTLENRMRLPLEVVTGIRDQCGPDFHLGYAFVAEDYMPGGITLQESIPFSIALDEEGVDHIDVFVGTYETMAPSEEARGHHKYQRRGAWDFSEKFKKVIKHAKVFQRTFGDYDPHSWENALEKGQVDVIQTGKALLCDPEFPKKVLKNRLDDIRPCTRCVYCVECGVIRNYQVACALNPALSREREYAIRPAYRSRKILIVGGGPGGLEAARVAALSGHEVTLVEKAPEVGGNLNINSLCVGNETYADFALWLSRQCIKAGVRFELNTSATADLIRGFDADVVILATGALMVPMPQIPGASDAQVVSAIDVLTGNAEIGERVLVVGGNRIGVDTTYTMAVKGLAEQITIVEPLPVPTVAYDMETMGMAYMVMTQLPKYGVQGFTGAQLKEIKKDTVLIVDRECKTQKIKADTIVNALPAVSNKSLFEELKDEVRELHVIGDCVKVRSVAEAVHEGAYVARQI